ncbi:serine/threonine-protein kinase [Kitasatospora sp. NE20-6]|uniref:serine/threonine-protein kinase n=1 Tax=Kitasatospora sp. NE20-6 TaxID=2859066 RepID=UPI0038B3B064
MNTGGPESRLIDGRFELLQRLGGGGMGLVWRARDNALHREVALKEVRPPDPAMAAADPAGARELRERVLREARALARLQHPHVVIIHHIVDSPEHPHPWLVMELVGGGSLADRLAQGPLTVPEAARIGRGVLSALRAAHAAGIQHRDVKPGNVLLRTDGTPVLTDFGIAAMQGATALTATGSLIGSPEYIAPERIRGQEGNPSSDLWSLGMMLYVAVEGHHPLRRATTLATLAAVLDETLPPPVRSGQLGPLLSSLLARDPAARPDAEMLDRLLAAAEQGGAPPVAWAPTSLDNLGPGPSATPFPKPGANVHTGPNVHVGPNVHTGTNGHGADTPTAGPAHPVAPYGEVPPVGGVPGGYGYPSPTGPTNPWSPQAGHPSYAPPPGPYGAPDSGSHTGPFPAVPARRSRAAVVAVSVAGVVLAGGLAWSLRPDGNASNKSGSQGLSTSSPGSATGGGTGSGGTASGGASPAAATSKAGASRTAAPPADAKNLHTPAGLRAVVDAIKQTAGTTQVYSLVVYPTYAIAEVPKAPGSKQYDYVDYRNGAATKRRGSTQIGDEKPVDLTVYNWDLVPGLIKKGEETLNVPKPTTRYVSIDPTFFSDDVKSLSIYIGDEYGSGYLAADLKGKVIRSYPAES